MQFHTRVVSFSRLQSVVWGPGIPKDQNPDMTAGLSGGSRSSFSGCPWGSCARNDHAVETVAGVREVLADGTPATAAILIILRGIAVGGTASQIWSSGEVKAFARLARLDQSRHS